MTATELRLGNLLMWEDDSKDIISVTEILKRENYYSVSFKGGCAQLDEFIPIPLTEDWFIKFGFEIDKHSNNLGFRIEIDEFYELHNNLGSTGFWEEDSFYLYVNGSEYETPTNIKYVHQLQNLYFALTGDELTEKCTK